MWALARGRRSFLIRHGKEAQIRFHRQSAPPGSATRITFSPCCGFPDSLGCLLQGWCIRYGGLDSCQWPSTGLPTSGLLPCSIGALHPAGLLLCLPAGPQCMLWCTSSLAPHACRGLAVW